MRKIILILALLLIGSLASAQDATDFAQTPGLDETAPGFATAIPTDWTFDANGSPVPPTATIAPEQTVEAIIEPAASDTPVPPVTVIISADGDSESIGVDLVESLFDRFAEENRWHFIVGAGAVVIVALVALALLHRSLPSSLADLLKRETLGATETFLRKLSGVDLLPNTDIDNRLFDLLYERFKARYEAEKMSGRG